MKLYFFFIASFLTLTLFSSNVQRKQINELTIVFYNVENLFDTIDAPNKIDEEFLPNGSKEWDSERYFKKVNDLSRVIYSIDSVKLPAIIGVCEIENDLVLIDLVKTNSLNKANYQIVWNDSPDERGIDCAFLYNPKYFRLLQKEFIPIVHPTDTALITRDIVYVKGLIGEEIFHFFVNHWPSRRTGQEESEKDRIFVAQVLRSYVDRIFASDINANILIMGDMNDEPTNISISSVLKAQSTMQPVENNQLVNLMYNEAVDGQGSYFYRSQWDMIDNLIVSSNVVRKSKGYKTTLDDGKIFHLPFMEFINDKGEMSPNRTYGRSYFGGVSDHFPIYMKLKK